MKQKNDPVFRKKRPYWRTLQEGKDYEFTDICGGVTDVDVVMVTYNHAPYIRHAIESVLMQETSFSYRLLIADDCSTDGTTQILEEYQRKYPNRIAVLLWKRNVGIRNNCITVERKISARYIATLEGDDYWTSPNKLEKALTFLEQNPDFVGYAHNIRVVDENEEIIHDADTSYINHYIQNEHIVPKNSIANMYQWKMLYLGHTSAIVNRNYQVDWKEKDWDTYANCREYLDVLRSVCMTIRGDVYFSREIMSAYRRVFSGTSWSAYSKNAKNMNKELYEHRIDLASFCQKVYGVEFTALDKMEEAFLEDSKYLLISEFSLKNLGIYIWIQARELARKHGRKKV